MNHKSFLVVGFFSVGLVALSFVSCGRPERDDGFALDKVVNPAAVVSEKNYEKWAKSWDHASWNVAVESMASETKFKADFAHAFLKSLKSDLPPTLEQKAIDFLESRLKLHITNLQNVRNLEISQTGAIKGFAHVTLNHTLDSLNGLSSLLGIKNTFATFDDKTLTFVWNAIERTPHVVWAEPDLISDVQQATYTPPGELSNAHVGNVFAKFKASGAYQYAFEKGMLASDKRRSVVVAVLDTGIDYKHPKLVNQMFKNPQEEKGTPGVDDDGNGYIDDIYGIDASFDPVDGDPLGAVEPGAADLGGPGASCTAATVHGERNQCGHGTHVAGIVAAQATGEGVLGVCSDCRVYSLRSATRKVVDGIEIDSGITDSAQIRSLAYVLNFTDPSTGALYIHVVNMSIGKYFRSRAIAFLVSSLNKNGILVVAAAGNEGTETPSYPAAFRSVLSVCALSSAQSDDAPDGLGEFAVAQFSNFGQWIDLCAPGTSIYSSWPGMQTETTKVGGSGAVKMDSGTSMSSPIVAGAAGYLLSLNKFFTNNDVKDLLLNYANANDVYKNEPRNDYFSGKFKYGNAGYYYLGKGALDLENSVKAINSEGVKNDMLGATEFSSQITNGCVVSMIASARHQPFWSFFSSMPFFLIVFGIALRGKRRLKNK